mmetsp:Transcript_14878/g.40883  ORF Transcript_14878/g.40883 Transcript_14878/m.40883 type:complete len:225 (-) Transcript_14878:21-695(-)
MPGRAPASVRAETSSKVSKEIDDRPPTCKTKRSDISTTMAPEQTRPRTRTGSCPSRPRAMTSVPLPDHASMTTAPPRRATTTNWHGSTEASPAIWMSHSGALPMVKMPPLSVRIAEPRTCTRTAGAASRLPPPSCKEATDVPRIALCTAALKALLAVDGHLVWSSAASLAWPSARRAAASKVADWLPSCKSDREASDVATSWANAPKASVTSTDNPPATIFSER